MVADNDSFAVAGAAEVGGVSYVGYAVYGFVGGLEAAVFDGSAGQQGGYFAGSGGAELAGGVDDAGNCGGVGSASDAVDYYCAYGKLAFVAFTSGFALDQGCEELGIADACGDYACIFFFGFTGRCVGFCTAAFGCFCGGGDCFCLCGFSGGYFLEGLAAVYFEVYGDEVGGDIAGAAFVIDGRPVFT